MKKVITYGTFDLFHYGHLRLLQNAKALGDYLIVGVTSDDFDKARGKVNNRQTLLERMEGVRSVGIADEIIVEEYDGQKIDDIQKYHADIFTVGSDWTGKFDYLKEYCEVVYLPRTEGVSSSDIRSDNRILTLEISGDSPMGEKVRREAEHVAGLSVVEKNGDAVYIVTDPGKRFETARNALEQGKHVLSESPIALTKKERDELVKIAGEKKLVLMESLKTAYSVSFQELVWLAKSGIVGDILEIRSTATSLQYQGTRIHEKWGSFKDWGPTAMLPVFSILGTDFKDKKIFTRKNAGGQDGFTRIDFLYDSAIASVTVACDAKSEGELIITGTKGYFYVPAPWWKNDSFEIRYENPAENRKYSHDLKGEGIPAELLSFLSAVMRMNKEEMIDFPVVTSEISEKIVEVTEAFIKGNSVELK